MTENLEEKLIKNFPKIFSYKHTKNEPFGMWGFECDDGWYELIYNLCEKIQNECNESKCEQVKALQVKEKFGGLRFYYCGGNTKIYQFVLDAEDKSTTICEVTGNKGDHCKKGYHVKTLCKESATLLGYTKIN